MTTPDYAEKIPNNVDLRDDRRLQRALESWQPNFLSWWESMGPTLPTQDVYLRTAVNVGRAGWAQFGHVPMRDYRWGIFLAERDGDRRIAFGAHKGEPAWRKVPGGDRAGPGRFHTATPAARTPRASSARSTRRPRTGSPSTCSPTSPTATASTSSAR